MTTPDRSISRLRTACVGTLLCASALWLVGCGETVYDPKPKATRESGVGVEMQPPPSRNEPPVVGPVSAPGNTTVAPELPPNAAAAEALPQTTDGTRKPAQEADANPKPMPGQNNDHSAPLATPR